MNGRAEQQNKFYLPRMNNQSPSFWKATWLRLKKNKGAMAGLVLIFIALFIALFGYFIAPDPSPFANRIIIEIGGEKPGFEQNFLLAKKTQPQPVPRFFTRLVSGTPDQYDFI